MLILGDGTVLKKRAVLPTFRRFFLSPSQKYLFLPLPFSSALSLCFPFCFMQVILYFPPVSVFLSSFLCLFRPISPSFGLFIQAFLLVFLSFAVSFFISVFFILLFLVSFYPPAFLFLFSFPLSFLFSCFFLS
jgi:hypothetical protein